MKRALLISLAVALVSAGCGFGKQIASESRDLEDYRAFRLAEYRGTRLARAQAYLEAHPRGAWADEVRAVFENEEAAYFEEAKGSREKALAYLVDLPRGPHAEPAMTLLAVFDEEVQDEELDRIQREVRRREAHLERASAQRQRVIDRVLEAASALLDEQVYGARVEEAPAALRRSIGAMTSTWGATPLRREDDYFYILPSRTGVDSRVVTIASSVHVVDSHIVSGRVEGADLFVRWAEAGTMRAFDPTAPADRNAASAYVLEVLGGLLEARLPAASCVAASMPARAILARACRDGWSAVATMGEGPGDLDAIVIRGPARGP